MESWIVVDRDNGRIITEIRDGAVASRINRDLYHVISSKEWIAADYNGLPNEPFMYGFTKRQLIKGAAPEK